MATVKEVLKIAVGEIGTKESPDNSNKTKYGKAYGLDGQPWCAMFLWWAFLAADASSLYFGHKKTAYTPTLANYYKSKDQWHKTPKAGDLVFFHNGTRICHVGIVEKVVSKDVIQTIEGNTSNADNRNGGMVMRRLRSIKGSKSWYVAGFGRPDYELPKVQPKPKPKAKPKALPVLKYGSKGAHVKIAQKALNSKGGYHLAVDGDFGIKTRATVVSFQAKKKLTTDGIIGPKTWKALGL